MCGSFRLAWLQRADLAGHDAEAGGPAELGGGVERELHAEADAEHGRARGDALAQQLVEPELAQALHRARERADAGHDQAGGGAQPLVIA